MTKITTPVVRETGFFERGRPLILELHSKHLVLRLKGESERWPVMYDTILRAAVARQAERDRREQYIKSRGRG